MNYSEIKKQDVANGPGVRVSLFVSGCTHHCKGCFNSETWDFNYGKPFTEETIEEIIEALRPSYINGLTVLGGEPFEPSNQEGIYPLLKRVREEFPEKDIWCYTGYLFDEDILGKMQAEHDVTAKLLKCIDVLVDGPFVLSKRNLMLNFRGSSNQRLIRVQPSLEQGEIVLHPLQDATNSVEYEKVPI